MSRNNSQVVSYEKLSTPDLYRVADLMFYEENIIFRHLYDSYGKFIAEDLPDFYTSGQHVFSEVIDGQTCYRYRFEYKNIRVEGPRMPNKIDPMFPSDARYHNLTYSLSIKADVTQYQDIVNISTSETTTRIIEGTIQNHTIAIIPLMVKSKWCSLVRYPNQDPGECNFDAGGYFIVSGNEKVVIPQDRMIENKPLVFEKKDVTPIYFVHINSRSYDPHIGTQVLRVIFNKNNVMTIRVPILNEINVCVLFRALGVETDHEIIGMITGDVQHTSMVQLIQITLDACRNEAGEKIMTQEQAFDYLVPKIREVKSYSDDRNLRHFLKKQRLKDLLANNFLPHQSGNERTKAKYLAYMIHRLLSVKLGELQPDDRDSYVNKRVSLPGDLMFDLFKASYKNVLKNCKDFFDARNDGGHEKPLNVIYQIKPNIIEQAFKQSLGTGNWLRQQGVAQVFNRLSYLLPLATLRRVDTPSGDIASNKNMKIRYLHPSSVGFLCCVTGDSEILQANNSLKLIQTMKNGDCVVTVDRNTLNTKPSAIQNFFSREDDVIQITTISGRVLKCTRDHPILTKSRDGFCMKDAGEITCEDLVIIKHTKKYIEEKQTNTRITTSQTYDKYPFSRNEEYDNRLIRMGLLNKLIKQDKLMVIARLMGILYSNGSITYFSKTNYHTIIHASSPEDMATINQDIVSLGFSESIVTSNYGRVNFRDTKRKWVAITDRLFGYFMVLMGFVPHNFTNEEYAEIPNWIVGTNKTVQREFLSGLFNFVDLYNNGRKVTTNDMIIRKHNSTELVQEFAEKVCDMVRNFDIDCMYEWKNDSIVRIYFENTPHNINQYVDNFLPAYNYSEVRPIDVEHSKFVYKNGVDVEEKFLDSICYHNDMVAVPVESVEYIGREMVYDFETVEDTHTFVVNSFVTSNCVQTPEHAKIGLVKHLSMIGTVSIMSRDQYNLLKEYLLGKVLSVNMSEYEILSNPEYYRVFLNGEWLGTTNKFIELEQELFEMKLSGIIDKKNVSVVADHAACEIRVYCDSGRLIRPVLRVENNRLLLTKKMIEKISLKATNKSEYITRWVDFVDQTRAIEYIDMEQQPYLMIADKVKTVYDMYDKMVSVRENKISNPQNRYDNFYLKYTHCEIHPSLLIGEIVTNIPFLNYNAGTRSIFSYAQGRQAISLYATNYRLRMDISYILWFPQKPLVSTRAARYTNTNIMASGENAIVAIACYTGYNQEDSLIVNKTSVERGKFRATNYKKHIVTIQKNQSTSEDDKFMKPDPSKVEGTKFYSYDKLNNDGYAPPETHLEAGDAIFGMVSPINSSVETGKPYRDKSEVYKSHVPGVVDRVHIDIQNQDGYLTRKALVRSVRIPIVGDKFASMHGQKGTIGLLLDEVDMPFTKDGLKPDIILNPNAIPSRMTIGQIVECLVGKASALQGMEGDGTPFEEYDTDAVGRKLHELGYHEHGYEKLTNGMTGEVLNTMIFIGPTYYQRLKQLVSDKIHSRARGPKTTTTRQAPEGRAKDGGLRLGEMERDALMAHGLSQFIKEKLLDNADAYTVYVCDICGLFARRAERLENKTVPSPTDTYYCPACNNNNEVSKVKMPYAFKLFLQELMSMSIAPRIRCVKHY